MRHIFCCFMIISSCFSFNVLALDSEEQKENKAESYVEQIIDFCAAHPKAIRMGLEGSAACLGYFLGGQKLLKDISMHSNNNAKIETIIHESSKWAKIGAGLFAAGALSLAGEALISAHELLLEVTEIDSIDE